MMSLATAGNRLFNVLLRLLGLLSVLAVFSMSLKVVGDIARAKWSAETFAVAALGVVLAFVSRALLTTPAYRPDLGDPPFFRTDVEARSRLRLERRWWTGDPK